MKKNIKIILLTIVSFIIMTIFLTVDAATANISASKTNATVGDTITISVSMNAAAWNTKLTGAVTKNFAGNSDDGENMKKVETATFTPTAAGTYTINLGGDVSDGTTNATTNVSGSVTITVAEKQQPAQQTQQTQTTTTQTQTQQQTQQAEPNFTNANKTMYTTGKINLRSSWSTSSAATTVPAGTEVTVTATSTNKVNGYVWYKVSYNGQTKYVASSLLTSTKTAEEQPKEEEKQEQNTEKSTNKALKDLVIENYKLSPEFTPETTKYSVEVKGDVDKLEISPVLQDEKSKFTIEGNENLKVGNNIIKITVTAEDGTTRIYTIAVSKTSGESTATEMLKLKDLKVNNANLQPSFSSEITNYVVEVDNPSSIKADAVVAIAEDADVEVTVSESENTEKNEKIITIMLEDKEGTKTGVYQITVKKASMNPISAIKNNKDNKIYYILGGIIAVLIVLIIIIIILLKKTSEKDGFDDEMSNSDELSDDYDYSLKNAIDEANTEYKQEYDEMVEKSSFKSQILNSTPTEYDVFKDNDDLDKTQVYDDFDLDNKGKKKGKHF